VANAKPGVFVAIEGGEGSGKSRLMHGLGERLRIGGHDVVMTREPGGTPLGEQVRGLLLGGETPRTPLAELMLFEAARAELVASVIKPGLDRGSVVLCDRFAASSVAYQSGGRGLSRQLVDDANRAATGGIQPNLTLLLDLPAQEGLRRRTGDGGLNRFDEEDIAFHERVNACFRQLAAEDPARWRVLDATLSLGDVLTAATAALEEFLR
jgi:dTMP kinase